MPRLNRSIEGFTREGCKIRNRACSSSTSSSSVLQNYRLKRAILVGKRGGTSTPAPTWKMNARLPSSPAGITVSSQYPPSLMGGERKQASVSARKLATALWEMKEIPSPQMKENLQERGSKKEIRGSDRSTRYVQSGSLPPHLSDPSHSPVSETTDRSWSGNHRRRTPVLSRKFRFNKYNNRPVDSLSGASLIEMETRSRGLTPSSSIIGNKSCLKDLSNGLMTSTQLLKILNCIWGLEEHHSSGMSLASALRVELERACVQVEQLIEEQRSDRNEINYLKMRFMEEKSAWKSKEQARINAAVQSIVEELHLKKKLRRRTERLCKKLGMALAETKTALSNSTKELVRERRLREMVEQVCNELVRGIAEDKVEVEEMKRVSAKVREELEKEREMLQLADVWREERVHMKLSEAKFQFEEKNASVDRLRNELEAFLKARRTKETRGGYGNLGGKVEVEDQGQLIHPRKSCMETNMNVDRIEEEGQVDGEDGEDEDGKVDSADSDLHSIELNMDSNNKSYSWSYATGTLQETTKMASVDENNERRSSNCIKNSRGSFSLDRGLSKGTKWDFSNNNFQHLGNGLDQGILSETNSLLEKQTCKLDPVAERYTSVKGLRDHLLSGSRIALRGLVSPTQQWSQPQPLLDIGDQACEGSNAAEKVKAMESVSKVIRVVKGETHNCRHNQLERALNQ